MRAGERGGASGRTRFPFSVLALTGLLALAGVAAALAGAGPDGLRGPSLLTVASFLGVLAVADFLQVQFLYRDDQESLDLFEAVLTPVVFALPSLEVVALTAAAKAAAQIYRSHRHQPIHPVKIGFNVAQWACASGVATLVFATFRTGWPATRTDIPALLLAMVMVTVVNNLAIAGVRWLASNEPLLPTLRETLPTFGPGLLNSVTNLCIGVLFVAAHTWVPAATPLWAALLWLLHQASRGHAATLADRDRLDGMQRATHTLAVPVDPKSAIPEFLAEVCRCFSARSAELILTTGSSRMIHRSDAGEHAPDPAATPAGASAAARQQHALLQEAGDHTLAALLAACDIPMRIWAQGESNPGGSRHDAIARRLRAADRSRCLVAPLRSPGRNRGVLCVYDQTGFEGFEEGELTVLETLAGEMASALERSNLLETILRERSRYADIVNRTSDGIATLSPDGTVRSWNPAFEQISGYPADEMTGCQTIDLLQPRDHDGRPVTFGGWASSDRTLPAEVEITTSRNQRRWLSCSATKAPASDYQGLQLILTARDVTDRKRAEALLAGQVRILDLIARDAPLSTTLRQLGRFSESQTDALRCLVLVLDEDQVLRPPGSGHEGHMADCPGHLPGHPHLDDDCPVAALCRTAVARRAPVIVADAAHDLDWQAWTAGGTQAPSNLRAAWAIPIVDADAESRVGGHEGEVLGAVAVLRDHPGAPSDGDQASLALVGHLAEIAIERTHAHDQLAHQAAHDALTGLPNRSAFIERSALALARTERSGHSVAVLFLDLDRFKFINDSFGHDTGDRLLQALARRLEEAVRPEDTLARFGGDEFTILCEGITDERDAAAIADRISEVLAKPFQLDEGEVFATCSIGISVASGAHHRPETLVENADAAMYRAKARGGNRHEVFDQEVRARAKHRLSMQNSLYRALERHEFRVVYQPLVLLETGEIVGVEALVRWLHPTRGLVGPQEFIGLAEETGLIVPIGTQVLRDACGAAARWREAGPGGKPLSVNVNLSARQFAHPDLVSVVAEILATTGTDPASLRFEITESTLMEDAENTTGALRELKALGVCLSIDDFGTGYSSLTYLKQFPVDELKVDRSFVDGLGTDPEDSAIVAAVIKLAHTLDLSVVAEGVETAEQARNLHDLRCDTAQGFYFGRATTAEDLDLSRNRR